ncbi:hypothetical protein MLGJGCBP_02393 [Rhodococcus sp. T7]|nr:hypothetical protein MLGJGCBP_02393 [Rhodococcus sp. T7]
MPLCARNLASAARPTSAPKSTDSSPMEITPRSATSRALRVRNTVVLPEPDGPMMTVTVPALTSKLMSRRT